MKKPNIILELEKELNCEFKQVDLSEIEIWRTRKIFQYSVNENNKTTGLAIYNTVWDDIPNVFFTDTDEFEYIEVLNLPALRIHDLSFIKKFKSLRKLYLSGNWVENISDLEKLSNLEVLNLSSCNISDITPIKNLTKLSTLNLGNNNITDISPLKGLHNLNKLDLQINPIKKLPEWITDYPAMDIFWKDLLGKNNRICLYDNPVENVPKEIIKLGKNAVRKYFVELQKEQQQYNFEVKLMLIGEGGTGKTSLLKKLIDKNNDLPADFETTLGIEIQKWSFPLNKSLFKHLPGLNQNEIFVNIWDLGGQKIYHGTHQIFFGENTFYILVEETREHKTDFSYWFNTIEQLAGEKANLLIVLNEKYGHAFKFDSEGYKSRFGFINEIFELDLSKKDETITKLQEFVKNAIQYMPTVGNQLPASYVRIKEEIFKTDKNYISFDKFCEVCEKHGISDHAGVKLLSKYLHETGIITHFIDDDILRNRVFLKSEWLVKTVYKVLEAKCIKEKKGRILKDDVCDIWNTENLIFEIGNLTQLMSKFGLMYKVKNKDEFVIPAHLPTEKPYIVWPHQNDGNLLIFKYEFGKYMPEGLMSHLIVSLHNYIDNEALVWHRGVNLMFENTFAEVIETYGEINTFEIKISGTQKREMLAVIRHNFSEIIKPFKKLHYRELIPCNCKTCIETRLPHFYEFSELIKRLQKNKLTIECYKSYEDVNVKKLIDTVVLGENESVINLQQSDNCSNSTKPTLFISYSTKDTEKVTQIKTALESEGFRIIIDSEAFEIGERFEDAIYKAISNSQATLFVISKDSLSSSWVAIENIAGILKQTVDKRPLFSAYIDKDFLQPDFVLNMIETKIEPEIKTIENLIEKQLKLNMGIENLQEDLSRLKKTKNNLPNIVQFLKERNCIDLSSKNEQFDSQIKKLIVHLNVLNILIS